MKPGPMPVSLIAAIVFCLAGADGHGREARKYTVEQFMKTVALVGGAFSSDEKSILYSSDRTGIFNAFTVPVQGGDPTQITFSEKESIFALTFLPNSRKILYSSDEGGNEIPHIYLLDETGKARDLTPYAKARAVYHGMAHDRKSFFFGCNKRDPKFMDIYEMDFDALTERMIFKNDGGYNMGPVSPDRRYIALSKTITRDNSDMYLLDLRTGELKHISPHKGDVNHSPQVFHPDSKNLYYLTDQDSEFQYLKRYEIASGKSETVMKTDWDIMYAQFSRHGKFLVVGINKDAATEIRVRDMSKGKWVNLPSLEIGNISSVRISAGERLMNFFVSGSNMPQDLYVCNLETGEYTRLLRTLNPEINPEDLVQAQRVRYESFDGLSIPAILYKPHEPTQSGKSPAVLWIHGGPGGQATVTYSPLFQYLVNHGYVVLAVNNRGSSGYGKTFFKLDDRKHGRDDLADCVAGKKYLESTGYVDNNRIGIMGSSYGGFMVLAALAFKPEEFALGVDVFGVSNWIRTIKNFPLWWEAHKEATYREMGNPYTDEEYLRGISPLFHSDKIVKPLMVLQGKNDPRVRKEESDEIVESLKNRGIPVTYLVFDDEGHGFMKKQNRIKAYRAIREFLDSFFKPEPVQ